MRVGSFDTNAPSGFIEVGVADDTIKVETDQNRDGKRYVLAAFDSAAGALANTELSPKLNLTHVQVITYVGYLLKFHAGLSVHS